GAQLLLLSRLEPFRVGRERRELGEPRLLGSGVACQVREPAPRRDELAPGAAEVETQARLRVADEAVEDVELVRPARKTPLLELARHREQALADAGDVLARDAPPPRVGARAAVGEDATGHD